jgi:hypothetical protein
MTVRFKILNNNLLIRKDSDSELLKIKDNKNHRKYQSNNYSELVSN